MSLYSVKVSLKLRAGVAQRPIFAFGDLGAPNTFCLAHNFDKVPKCSFVKKSTFVLIVGQLKQFE